MADFVLIATYIGDLHDAATETEIDLVCRTCTTYIETYAHAVSLDLLNKLAAEHTCRN